MNFIGKKNLVNKILYVMIGVLIVSYISIRNVSANDFPDDISIQQKALQNVKSNVKISFLNKEISLKNSVYLSTGRLYIPFEEFVNNIGGVFTENSLSFSVNYNNRIYNFDKTAEKNFPKSYVFINNVQYISLYNLLEKLEMIPVFDSVNDKINICFKDTSDVPKLKAKENSTSAYLRLEDIMADGKDKEPKYDDLGLEKLRILSDYLYNRGQVFYIAWIPVYKNPTTNMENDLTKTFDTYNASFLYTLDYIVDRNGHIGLHGLTHQYNNEISSVGNEFDKKSPFSKQERAMRMLQAKEIARDLGFKAEFFEFPHYEATNLDFKCAEKYFDIIYQQYPYIKNKNFGHIEKIQQSDGREVLYVPTPADYVWSRYDWEGIKTRMDTSKQKGMIMSLFFHPTVDMVYITAQTSPEGIRKWKYEENALLPSVLNKIFTEGYSFTTIK